MIRAGENRNNRGKTCPTVTLCNTKPTWNLVESKWGLRGERPASNRPRHQNCFLLHTGLQIHFVPHEEHCVHQLERQRGECCVGK